MSDVIGTIRESIMGTSGLGGVLKFNALYAEGFETKYGSPDLPAINEAVCRTFPPDQASAIMVDVTRKLGILPPMPDIGVKASAAESPQGNGTEGAATFAKYINADPNSVRDIVAEGRRVRLAMGKPIIEPPGQQVEAEKPAEKATLKPVMATAKAADGRQATKAPARTPATESPRMAPAAAEAVSDIDREIKRFAYGQTAYTSIDILDFIRYMKDKGYSFEEYMVLEKIYIKIEERKKEAQSTIEREVEGIFNGAQASAEPEINRLIRRLRETGLVFEEEDVRRMARVAALRRA